MMYREKIIFTAFLLSMMLNTVFSQESAINKQDYYHYFSSDSLPAVSQYLERLEKTGEDPEVNAFAGALRMRMAGLEKSPARKLRLFREGSEMLEDAIAAEPDNTEYRFLRLCIQENAPAILDYNNQVKQDKAVVMKKFRDLPPYLRNEILDYAEDSEVLSEHELKQRSEK